MTDMNEVVKTFDRLDKQEDPFYYRVKLQDSEDEYEGPFVKREFSEVGFKEFLVGVGGDGDRPQFQPISEPRVR